MSRKKKARNKGSDQSWERNLNRARRFYAAGRLPEALTIAKKIVAGQPNNADAYVILGAIAHSDKQHELAEQLLRKALVIAPENVDAHNRLGLLLRETGDLQGAENTYRKAVALQPDNTFAFSGLGAVLANQAKHHEAARVFEQAFPLDHKPYYLYSNLLWCCQYDEATTAARRFAIAKEYGRRLEASAVSRSIDHHKKQEDPDRPLRLGYVSPDLGMHPVGIFFSCVLSGHDSDAFHVYCYSGRVKEDEMTEKLKTWSRGWRSIAGLSDDKLTRLIRQDRIDILVDLNGHSGLHRLGAFALKPAPVQVSWLGYPETTGLSAIDYLITDPVTVLPDYEQYFVEKVLYLPNGRFCYRAPEYAPAVSPPPCLTNGYVTFGSFNNLTKVSEDVFRLWCKVLSAVPDSRLLLKWRSLSCEPERARIIRLFQDTGLTRDRLELRGAVPYRELLNEYADVDIALDPFPFSGGLTSCDALWQGVPIITLPRDRPASRQTLSFLKTIGFDEFAADSSDDYVRIARDLAHNHEKLARLRSEIRPHMAASALCDTEQLAHNLEAIYRRIWKQWLSSCP